MYKINILILIYVYNIINNMLIVIATKLLTSITFNSNLQLLLTLSLFLNRLRFMIRILLEYNTHIFYVTYL